MTILPTPHLQVSTNYSKNTSLSNIRITCLLFENAFFRAVLFRISKNVFDIFYTPVSMYNKQSNKQVANSLRILDDVILN